MFSFIALLLLFLVGSHIPFYCVFLLYAKLSLLLLDCITQHTRCYYGAVFIPEYLDYLNLNLKNLVIRIRIFHKLCMHCLNKVHKMNT
jgi:hypothetical protein